MKCPSKRKQWRYFVISSFLRDSRTHKGTTIESMQSRYDNATADRHASVSFWIKQKNIQLGLKPVYTADPSPCGYKTFHVLKRATGRQAYPMIDLIL